MVVVMVQSVGVNVVTVMAVVMVLKITVNGGKRDGILLTVTGGGKRSGNGSRIYRW